MAASGLSSEKALQSQSCGSGSFFFFLGVLRLWDPKRAQQGPGSPRSARTIKTEQNPWCRASAATGEGHRVLGWKSL